MSSSATQLATTDPSHYGSDRYLSEYRWASYWHQIACVLENYEGEGVLEIGVGNGTVAEFLKKQCQVTTIDIDPKLEPDIVGDIREIDALVGDRQWGVVLCAEVLEHLPFDEFVPVLQKLERHTGKVMVLGLPHAGPSLAFWLKLPFLPALSRALKLPYPVKHPAGGVHFWEIGKRGYSLRRIRGAIRDAGFRIQKTYVVPGSPHHRMFVLRKAHSKG